MTTVPLTALQADRIDGAGAGMSRASFPVPHSLVAVIDFDGIPDRAALRTAIVNLAARHDALRVVLGRDGQRLIPAAEIALGEDTQVHRLDTLDARGRLVSFWTADSRKRLTALCEIAAELADRDMDRDGCLAWFSLEQWDTGRYALLVRLDQLISDAWSLHVVCDDLEREYTAILKGARLPPPVASYEKIVRDDLDWLGHARGQVARRRAAERLARAVPLCPVLGPSAPPAERQAEMQGAMWTWPDGLAGRLDAACRAHRTTRYTAIVAALAVATGAVLSRDRVSVLLPLFGRDRAQVEPVVMWRSNPTVITVEVGRRTAEALVRDVQRQVLAALDDQRVPFPVARRDAGLRVAADGAVADVALQYVPASLSELGRAQWGEGLRATIYPVALCPANARLDVAVAEIHGGFTGTATITPTAMPEPVLTTILARFQSTLSDLATVDWGAYH